MKIENDDAKEISFFNLYALPKLAFDHLSIINKYLAKNGN